MIDFGILLLPYAYYLVLSRALYQFHGHLTPAVLAITAFFFASWGGLTWIYSRPATEAKTARPFLALLSGLLLIQLTSWFNRAYPIDNAGSGRLFLFWIQALKSSVIVASFFAAALLARMVREKSHSARWAFRSLAALLGLLLLTIQILVPAISPHPHIDVFVNNTAAVDFFLQGLNPYSQHYVDIYAGAYAYKPGFLYLPGVLYCLAPFRALFGDIRYGLIFAQLLSALALARLIWKKSRSELWACVTPLLWAAFPVAPFVIEQAWVDTLLIGYGFVLLVLLQERRWIGAAVMMGFLSSIKQYGGVLPLLGCFWILREGGWRRALHVALIAGAVLGALVLPWLIFDPHAFWDSVVTSQLSQAMRPDGSSFRNYWVSFHGGRDLPGWLSAALSVSGILFGSIWILRKRRSPEIGDLALAGFASFGCAFLFGKWAFCNYHFLIASFVPLIWVWGII